jgi:hypothetical protein
MARLNNQRLLICEPITMKKNTYHLPYPTIIYGENSQIFKDYMFDSYLWITM